MNSDSIHEVEINGSRIQDLIETKLLPSLAGVEVDHAILAMLTMIVLLAKPTVSLDLLQKTVMSVSQYIVLSLADTQTMAQA